MNTKDRIHTLINKLINTVNILDWTPVATFDDMIYEVPSLCIAVRKNREGALELKIDGVTIEVPEKSEELFAELVDQIHYKVNRIDSRLIILLNSLNEIQEDNNV